MKKIAAILLIVLICFTGCSGKLDATKLVAFQELNPTFQFAEKVATTFANKVDGVVDFEEWDGESPYVTKIVSKEHLALYELHIDNTDPSKITGFVTNLEGNRTELTMDQFLNIMQVSDSTFKTKAEEVGKVYQKWIDKIMKADFKTSDLNVQEMLDAAGVTQEQFDKEVSDNLDAHIGTVTGMFNGAFTEEELKAAFDELMNNQ